MVLLIDNYDSFVYNLVQAFLGLGVECVVHRNDRITVEEIEAATPSHLVVSPGPCTPREAGISCEAIRRFAGKIPLLGVCLGHQCMGEVFGGKVVRAPAPVHGRTSPVEHDGRTIFRGLAGRFEAARYHSLVIEPATLPADLERSAWTADGVIMGVRHRAFSESAAPLEGVQFHPESYMTEVGPALLRNFLEGAR
jgi:anthranilate synthase/aminodeoxychorismate synthase-like glutamine amidotransferase